MGYDDKIKIKQRNMGRNNLAAKDTVTKVYIKDAGVFADAFNYLIFEGDPVIDPLKLHKMDTTEIGMPYGEGKTSYQLWIEI